MKPYYQDDFCTIYHGDCREIVPQLEPVDLVLNNSLKNSTNKFIFNTYENTKRSIQGERGGSDLESEKGGDSLSLHGSKLVNGENSELLQSFSDCNEQDYEAAENTITREGQSGKPEREVCRRSSKHNLQANNSERQMFDLQFNNQSCNSPQERDTYRQQAGKSTSSMRCLPQLTTQKAVVEIEKIICITDPPYGVKRDKGFEGFGGFGPPIARRRFENDNWDQVWRGR